MSQDAEERSGAAQHRHAETGFRRVDGFDRIDGVHGLLVIDHQQQVAEVEADAYRLPLGVVEIGAEENAFPFVQQTGMHVELAGQQFQSVVGLALTNGQQSVRQRGAEAERQVVAFIAVRLHGHERGSVERHGGGVLTKVAVIAERALACEPVNRLLLQEGDTSSAVQARDVQTAQQFDGTVFASEVGRTDALVVGDQIDAVSVDARLVSRAFVDLILAVVALVAGVALTRVVGHAVDASAEFARTRIAQSALVDVDLTVVAFEAGQAAANVSAGSVVGKVIAEDSVLVQGPVGAFQTRSSVLARLGVTFVDVHFAVLSLVTGEALAEVIFDFVDTFRAVDARSALAIVDVDLTVISFESSVRTVALVRIYAVQADTFVQTRRRLKIPNKLISICKTDTSKMNK